MLNIDSHFMEELIALVDMYPNDIPSKLNIDGIKKRDRQSLLDLEDLCVKSCSYHNNELILTYGGINEIKHIILQNKIAREEDENIERFYFILDDMIKAGPISPKPLLNKQYLDSLEAHKSYHEKLDDYYDKLNDWIYEHPRNYLFYHKAKRINTEIIIYNEPIRITSWRELHPKFTNWSEL